MHTKDLGRKGWPQHNMHNFPLNSSVCVCVCVCVCVETERGNNGHTNRKAEIKWANEKSEWHINSR